MKPITDPTPAGMTAAGAHEVPSQVPPSGGHLAIVGASVIDARSPDMQSDRTVVVRDGHIAMVGPADQVVVPSNATVLDAAGKVLIPGLWDMHVHQFDPAYLALHLRNGVTGIRHMSGIPAHHEWRRQVAEGILQGPRSILASPIIDGPTPLRPGSTAVHDAADARQAVRNCHDAGAEFIKIYNLVPHDAFVAIADECADRAIPFAGHLPLSVSLEEAAGRGQVSVEHLEGLLIGTSHRRDELSRHLRALQVRNLGDMGAVQELTHQAGAAHDSNLASELFDQLVDNGTWLTPTLAVLEASALAGTPAFPLTDYLPYIEPYLRPIWEGAMAARTDEEERRRERHMLDLQRDLVGRAHRAGVQLLAGTDTFVPGFSLHDELQLLVRSGLSPSDALRTATMNPAIFLGIDAAFGTIEPGKVADMLLLKHSPLEDISNTRSVDHVILAGHSIRPDTLPAPDAPDR